MRGGRELQVCVRLGGETVDGVDNFLLCWRPGEARRACVSLSRTLWPHWRASQKTSDQQREDKIGCGEKKIEYPCLLPFLDCDFVSLLFSIGLEDGGRGFGTVSLLLGPGFIFSHKVREGSSGLKWREHR